MLNGSAIQVANGAPGAGIAALTVAYNDAAGRTLCPVAVAVNLGDLTLYPGLYKSTDGLEITGSNLTLHGGTNDVFIFQMATTFLITTGIKVTLAGGAQAKSVFWQLIFDDSDLLLTVGVIWVSGQLSKGSADCRLQSNIMITFDYQLSVGDADLGIQVWSGNQLDLHGTWFNPTWTRLAATAAAGQNWVTLQDAVNWQPMQLVAVMTSMFRDEATNQNEVMTVNYVDCDGKKVVFMEDFQFDHYGGSEYQTEVALLSRSITLQGGPESVSRSKGGHVKVIGQARLQGVAAFRMGQRNLLGYYPFHFHHVGWVDGESYVSDCAVYNSFYRCFVVHGTHNLVLTDNVAFHAAGHCYYLEDGVEEHNRFEHNLAAFVHVIGSPAGGPSQDGTTHAQDWSSLAQPADAAASGFYVSNSNNEFVGNAASVGWAGYSFPRLEAPIGDYAWITDFIPHQRPLKLFDSNTVHSSGYYFNMAGGIYVGGKLWINTGDSNKLYYSSGRWAHDTRDEQGNAATMVFTNCKAWLAQWGISHWGDRVAVDRWEAHDCTRGANVFGDASLSNAFITGQSANVWSDFPGDRYDLDPIAGFRWYDTSVRTVLSNITFRNFTLLSNVEAAFHPSVWYTMPASDDFKPSFGYRGSDVKSTVITRNEADLGKCDDSIMLNDLGGYAAEVGSYCAVTCQRCTQGAAMCGDKLPLASGGRTCVQHRDAGNCYQEWFKIDSYCARTCGFCGGDGTVPCVELVPTAAC
ncbi:hypothetical protein FOA52_015639 [Chlamydomonas sp. UWO 241]|nr:hypothetical protein FOA52_015639 [Chlamydomonas sp. UWO 241]